MWHTYTHCTDAFVYIRVIAFHCTCFSGWQYWTKDTPAASASLSSLSNWAGVTVPRVSLANPPHRNWQELGPWMSSLTGFTDFTRVKGSWDRLQWCMQNVCYTHLTCRREKLSSFWCAGHHRIHKLTWLNCLRGHRPLWVTHRYDIGLMTGATPLVVHPQSEYRSCMKQHPLKQVLDFLIKAPVRRRLWLRRRGESFTNQDCWFDFCFPRSTSRSVLGQYTWP